jgi:hypothetical protein
VVDVVELPVVLVLDDVVVVLAWQTEMLTVLPLPTWVPEAGLWLSTLPGCAPLAHPVSKVVLGTRPIPVMAFWAALADCPTTLGTETHWEMTTLTAALGSALIPAAGLCEAICPLAT